MITNALHLYMYSTHLSFVHLLSEKLGSFMPLYGSNGVKLFVSSTKLLVRQALTSIFKETWSSGSFFMMKPMDYKYIRLVFAVTSSKAPRLYKTLRIFEQNHPNHSK